MANFIKRQKISNHGATNTSSKSVFVRSFEHVDGNWPSHVYLNILEGKRNSGFFCIKRICISHCVQSYGVDKSSDHFVVEEQSHHVSLSRPFVLRRHQIEAFIQLLQDKVHYFHRFSCHVFSEYQELINDSSTRGFVCIPLADSQGLLLQLVRQVDTVLTAFKQPEYYKEPIFHISVASRPTSSEDTSLSSAAIIRVHRHFDGSDHDKKCDRSSSDSDSGSDNGGELTYPNICKQLSSSATNENQTTVPVKEMSKCSEVRSHDLSSSCVAEDCMGGVVHFDSIDCKIGNRLFRLMLAPTGGDRSGQHVGNTFCEIFPTTTTASSKSSRGKG